MQNSKISANGSLPLNRTGIQLEQDQKRQAILDEVMRLRPDTELSVNKYTTDLVYYTVSVIKGKIKVNRDTRGIYLNCEPSKLVKYFYRTELEARQAIEAVMPKAVEHFKQCLNAYRELTTKMGFNVGHNYDGDTHGIYNEYDYVSFKLDEFNFQFPINE